MKKLVIITAALMVLAFSYVSVMAIGNTSCCQTTVTSYWLSTDGCSGETWINIRGTVPLICPPATNPMPPSLECGMWIFQYQTVHHCWFTCDNILDP